MTTAQQIVGAFELFRMPPTPVDMFKSTGKAILENRVEEFLKQNKPIEFVMLGFPFKSINDRDKVLGKIPDKAEQISIQTFDLFNQAIKRIYSPGMHINIMSDGYVFNDVLEVPDCIVQNYKEMSLDMAKGTAFNIIDLKELYSSGSLTTKREKLMGEFGITPEQLEHEILFNPDVNFLYRGMIRFMQEELAPKSFPSGTQLQKAAKLLTRQMMFRNEAFSNLVRKEFSHAIRLSMHPSVNSGAKFSFQMIPNAHHSAWHSALIIDNGQYSTMHKKDAIKSGYELVYHQGKPSHFQK